MALDNIRKEKEVLSALRKKATGYIQRESVEEYTAAEDDTLKLCKKKITTKHIPPDVAALKVLLAVSGEGEKALSEMTDAELEKEKSRLLYLLKDMESGGGDEI